MPQFNKVGDKFDGPTPALAVEVTPASPMPPGQYTFQLVVQDADGLQSDPATIVVTVRQPLSVTIEGPKIVRVGQAFTLNGIPVPAQTQGLTFHWTLIQKA